jgi:hypothetical protein
VKSDSLIISSFPDEDTAARVGGDHSQCSGVGSTGVIVH